MQTNTRIIRTGAKYPAARLFCLPYAGGGASIYRQWAAKLPAWIEVCALQLPGRESRMREASHTQMKAAVEELANTIYPLLDKPFYLFGHSMGARISFELARFLRRHNLPQPQRLFVSASRGPHLPRHDEDTHTLPDRELLAEIKKLGGTPDSVLENDELMELFLPMLRADFTLLETYKCTPEPPLVCPISAFHGTEDTEVSEEEMAGWQEQTLSTFKLVIIPDSGHFFIHSHQDLLLRYITQEL